MELIQHPSMEPKMELGQCAILTVKPRHGLLLTLVVLSLSKGLRYSIDLFTEAELEMSSFAFLTSFQLRGAKCSQEVPCLATLLDLQLMGNILSYQVKSIFDKYFSYL